MSLNDSFHPSSSLKIIKLASNVRIILCTAFASADTKLIEDIMNAISKNNIINYDLAKFAGRIGTKHLSFFSFIKITISLSVLFALIMLIVR